jgi:hypothetical protein
MGLAPSGNGENPGKSVVAKVPVPIFSQPPSEAAKSEFSRIRLPCFPNPDNRFIRNGG